MLGLFNENFIGSLYFGLVEWRLGISHMFYQQSFIGLARHDTGIGNGLCKNV